MCALAVAELVHAAPGASLSKRVAPQPRQHADTTSRRLVIKASFSTKEKKCTGVIILINVIIIASTSRTGK
jgi:hypothetical protein